jgi:glycosyltransferase involved in cell wall biosynthesis
MKKIAILLATYNGEKHLKEQIDSILNQSLQSFDLYIRDDKSTDNTRKIIKEYLKKYPDKIFDISDNKQSGSSQNNFLLLLKHVLGKYEYYMFSDQDDVWLQNKVEDEYNEIKSYDNKKPILVHSDLYVVDSKLNIKSDSFINYSNLTNRELRFNELLIQNNVTGCTMIFNNELAKKIDFNCNKILHDHHLSVLASSIGEIHLLKKPLVYYRQHNNNVVGAQEYSLFHKLSDFSSYKKDILDNIENAKCLMKYYSKTLKSTDTKILKEFSNIKKHNKFYRIRFIIKNKIFKPGLPRIIFELIFI